MYMLLYIHVLFMGKYYTFRPLLTTLSISSGRVRFKKYSISKFTGCKLTELHQFFCVAFS